MARHKRAKQKAFDNHREVSDAEVRTLLRFFEIPDSEWDEWISGQTCPMLDGKLAYFHWDVKRFIDWKTKGVLPIWD